MLDATEDGNDERPASSRKEGSPEAINTDVGNRMVYKLVKVRDDGSVLAATEDDVFQCLVGGSDNGLSSYDPEGSDAVGDDDDEGSDYVASDGDDLSGRTNIIPIQDLAVERQRLKAQIEVLDCILMRVDLEERRRLSAEKEAAEKVCCREGNPSTYVNAGDVGSGEYKRQRRPNPKYFDAVYDAGDDFLMGPPLSSSSGEPMPRPLSSRKPPRNTVVVSPRVTSGWGSHRSSSRAAGSHRARAVVTQKPFIRTINKAASTCPVLSIVSKDDHNIMSLDNLSIRELHEAFCSTYGRETSVKDKHWLKRQISAGWVRQQDVVIRSSSHQQVQNKLKARLDRVTQAEQPLPTTVPSNVGNIEREVANESHLQKENDVEHFRDTFRNRLGSRCFQRRVTTPAILSRGGSFGILAAGSLNGSSDPRGQTAIYGEVVNNGEVVEGKRQRKPNRRYIEDEAGYVASGFVPVHDTRSFYGETEGAGLNSTKNYSWRTVETDGSSDIIGRHGNVRGSNLQNVSSKKFSPIQRPKLISSGMKRKVGGRAAKLVKMAHTTARAARHDAEAALRKAKFQLPTTPDIITVANRQKSLPPLLQYLRTCLLCSTSSGRMHLW
ncbi:hypothetical protein KC19_9G012100 [Ceratodon purpureus]|uniref:Uncharacterized protein n=1 Tax=Ceratodon purpureus TaxID=3225 RepID=A0A8T0GV20_CERPU|nr:hypothetical protein KC19_9G012100 [Ceratodon purpureus]